MEAGNRLPRRPLGFVEEKGIVFAGTIWVNKKPKESNQFWGSHDFYTCLHVSIGLAARFAETTTQPNSLFFKGADHVWMAFQWNSKETTLDRKEAHDPFETGIMTFFPWMASKTGAW